MLPGREQSHWIDSTPTTAYPPLTEGITVDVVVIGGGIAGICAAWELARRGKSVVLLEADRVAAGVTGHTTAKLSVQHSLIYADVAKTFGAEGAKLYATSQQDAVEHVASVSSELGIDCELERLPSFTYGDSASTVSEVEAEVEAACAAGLPASFVTETELPYDIGGAIRVENQAQFHPRKYLLGLVADFLAHGGQIFEQTRVTGLEEGGPCRVTTQQGGAVMAQDVVVATHYPIFDRALLFARLEVKRELVVAGTIPESDDPHGMYITTDHGTRSVRTAPYADGRRLLIVTGEHFAPGAGGVTERFEKLAGWAGEMFPRAELTLRWATQDNTTTDKVPYVGYLHPATHHVYVATGFGGWGMSSGVMSGRLLAARILGEGSPWAALYDPKRLHPTREVAPMLKLQAKVGAHFLGDRLAKDAGSVEDIKPGSGALCQVNGKRCAVYRNDDGSVQAVSATCTHLGCLVKFNDAERAWECPCHGSRFAVDGQVIQGPATRALAPEPLN